MDKEQFFSEIQGFEDGLRDFEQKVNEVLPAGRRLAPGQYATIYALYLVLKAEEKAKAKVLVDSMIAEVSKAFGKK